MAGGAMLRFAYLALLVAFLFGTVLPAAVQGQAPAPSPEMESDGHAIDQGIAYFLLFLALVLTFLNPLDAFPNLF